MTPTVKLTPPSGWYALHAGPLPIARLRLFIALADGALWRCSLGPVLQDQIDYYAEEEDWDHGAAEQPTGRELRGLILVNTDWSQAALDCHWRNLRRCARHISGPKTKPPDDLLWAVDEDGGDLEVFTDLPPTEQYRQPHYWRDVEFLPGDLCEEGR